MLIVEEFWVGNFTAINSYDFTGYLIDMDKLKCLRAPVYMKVYFKKQFHVIQMALDLRSHEVDDCYEKERYVLSYSLSLHSTVMLEHTYGARWPCGRVKRSRGPREWRGQPRPYLRSTLIPNSFFYGVIRHSVNRKATFFISAFSVFSTALSRAGKAW